MPAPPARIFPVALCLAYREYEAWFLAAASSLAGQRDLPADLADHPAPETPRGCKEWLSSRLPAGRGYSETDDQPAFTATFDLDRARTAAPSFDKCWREAESLFYHLAPAIPQFSLLYYRRPSETSAANSFPLFTPSCAFCGHSPVHRLRLRPFHLIFRLKLKKMIDRVALLTLRNIKQNLFWAFAYNIAGLPIAAGVLFPFTGWLLNPMFAGAAMSLSSITVVANALRLRSVRL